MCMKDKRIGLEYTKNFFEDVNKLVQASQYCPYPTVLQYYRLRIHQNPEFLFFLSLLGLKTDILN